VEGGGRQMSIGRTKEYAGILAFFLIIGLTFWFLELGAKAYGYSELQSYVVAAFVVFSLWLFPIAAIALVVKYRRSLRVFFYDHPKDWLYALIQAVLRFSFRVLRWLAKIALTQLFFTSFVFGYTVLGFWGLVKWQELHGTHFGGTLFTSYYWYQVVEIAVFAAILARLTVRVLERFWEKIRSRMASKSDVEIREVPTVWVSEPGAARNLGWVVPAIRWLISAVLIAGAGVYGYRVLSLLFVDVTGSYRTLLVALTFMVVFITFWVFARALGSPRHTKKEVENNA